MMGAIGSDEVLSIVPYDDIAEYAATNLTKYGALEVAIDNIVVVAIREKIDTLDSIGIVEIVKENNCCASTLGGLLGDDEIANSYKVDVVGGYINSLLRDHTDESQEAINRFYELIAKS